MNPWLIILVLLVWAASLAKAWHMGAEQEIGRAAAAAVVRTDKIIRQHNADVVIDMQAAAEAERARGQKLLRQQEGRHALELDIARTEALRAQAAAAGGACAPGAAGLDDVSLGLLRDAVRRANAGPEAQPAGGGPGGVPAPAGAAGRGVGNHPPLAR